MNTISKGTLYSFNNKYSIYQIQNNNLIYYLSIPNTDHDIYKIYLGFPKQDIDNLTKEEITREIKEISNIVNTLDDEGIYLFCPIPLNERIEAANDNDNLLYGRLLSKIHAVTSDSYNVINENNKVNIDSKINIIKQSDYDSKFTDWLEIKLNGYINGINLSTLIKEYNNNLFNNTSDIIFTDSDNGTNFGSKGFSGNGIVKTNSNVKVKKLVKPSKHGYTSFTLIILIISLFMGIVIAYLALYSKI